MLTAIMARLGVRARGRGAAASEETWRPDVIVDCGERTKSPAGSKFWLGDLDETMIKPLDATTLDGAVIEARKAARSMAAETAAGTGRTSRMFWSVSSPVDGGRRRRLEAAGTEWFAPSEPACTGWRGHKWRYTDPECAGFSRDDDCACLYSFSVCRRCDTVRTVREVQIGDNPDDPSSCIEDVSYMKRRRRTP